MNKTILQISSDFADQKIYVNLVRKLSELGYEQEVYVPVRWENKIDGNRDDSIKDVTYNYSFILKRNLFFKLRYFRKIRIITEDLIKKSAIEKIDLVHAHFLFSDGGVAYRLKQKFGIPYVVSVRATDIHYFFSKLIHLRKFGLKIMDEAEKVIFINHAYKSYFEKRYLAKSFSGMSSKFEVIPNAIDDKWFKIPTEKKDLDQQITLLYVGRVIKRKKLDVVVKAMEKLNKYSPNRFRLKVVGTGPFLDKVKKRTADNIIFHGHVSNFEELLSIYRDSHIFTMPSVKETFGLVYIEAMTQGLPIIYCENEAVDGFFNEYQVGKAVNANDVNGTAKAIEQIIKEYDVLSINAIREAKKFNWDEITGKFVEVYKKGFC